MLVKKSRRKINDASSRHKLVDSEGTHIVVHTSPKSHYRVIHDDFRSGFMQGFWGSINDIWDEFEVVRYAQDKFADDKKRYGKDMYYAMDVYLNAQQESKTD